MQTQKQEDQQRHLAELLDCWTSAGPGKMFISREAKSEADVKKNKKIHRQLKNATTEIEGRKLQGSICRHSCALYEALVYKFGVSNRHQKFWRIALRIYRELRRLNSQNVLGPFTQFSQRLEKSGFLYAPTKRAIRFLGALLLRRILHLDKLRLICAKSADCSMGFIELKHFLTFNLMSIAIASDVASEARRQMQQLASIYTQLAGWFSRSSSRLPSSIDAIKFQSLPILDHEGKRVVKQLKKHDLDLFRQHIEGINQDQEDETNQNEDTGKSNMSIATFKNMPDIDIGKIVGGQRALLKAERRRKSRVNRRR